MRLSNFLIWQAAYAEYYFTPAYWPDFDEAEVDRALDAYAQRDRRFGGLPSADSRPSSNGKSAPTNAQATRRKRLARLSGSRGLRHVPSGTSSIVGLRS